uniref:fatty acid-binding protein, intestinal n=1 Tax=Myxine glutinosa TaxID=7769 RepID=UPI00358F4878
MAFSGSWKVEKSENYGPFLEKMGMNMVKRAAAAHDNLTLTITQDGDNFIVKESSTFRTKEIPFSLGKMFQSTIADGTEVEGCWELQEGKLTGRFTRKDNKKDIVTVREIQGGNMTQTMTYEGVTVKRHFKKA